MESVWCKETERPSFEALKGNFKTDVLIIGGGMVGILCGYMLKSSEHSWDCPCHGSRFTKDGRLLDNPATGDTKK